MKTTTLLLLTSLLSSAFAQNCNGSSYNNYCCVNGQFSGPVISSIRSGASAIRSSAQAGASSLRESADSVRSSLRADATARRESIRSEVSGATGIFARAAAMITAAPVAKRAITKEVMEGLTCIGDSLNSSDGGNGFTGGSGGTTQNTFGDSDGDSSTISDGDDMDSSTMSDMTTTTSSDMSDTTTMTSGGTSATDSSSAGAENAASTSSTPNAAMKTGAPMVVLGAAAAFAYGAM